MTDGSTSLRPVSVQSNLFESLKQVNEYGREFWSARSIQQHLGYSGWKRFNSAIKKAMDSCTASGNDPDHHFVGADNMVELGSGAKRSIADLHLSRFACYLIAQNGDPRKTEIALAQQYFAIQTRRQELSDELAKDQERLEERQNVSQGFKELCGVARSAGVQNKMFGVFHDAGYKGMYGGLGLDQIKARKGIGPKENLMDRADTTELAANAFRYTQARDKIARERVRDQQRAIEVNREVGATVRNAIKKIGGTMPEDLPAVEHIKVAKKRIKEAQKKIAVAETDALVVPPASMDDL